MSRFEWEDEPPPTRPQLVRDDEQEEPKKKSQLAGILRWLGKAWLDGIKYLGTLRFWE